MKIEKKYTLVLIISIPLFFNNLKAQSDSLLLLNGNVLKGQILDTTDACVLLSFKKKGIKQRRLIENINIFSYQYKGKAKTLYFQDSTTKAYLTAAQMKSYVLGEYDANYDFKPRVATIGGIVVGAAAGFLMVNQQNLLYIATPLVYAGIQFIPPTKARAKKVSHPNLLNDDNYLKGYERVARGKNIQHALLSSFISLGASFLIFSLAK